MVSSMTRKMISLAISLLVVVISLTGAALAATAPTVTNPTRLTPGFGGAPGKMARDDAGNIYVADFWAKGIMKLNSQGGKIGFIPTQGRPAAVAVMPDSRLVVAMQAPQAYVAFYSQSGVAPYITGAEVAGSVFTGQAKPFYRPVAITRDAAGYIYVLDAGDISRSATENLGCVRVYDAAGVYKFVFGARTNNNAAPAASPAGDFQLKQPMGIAYESVANQIVVTDTMNGRLQFYNAYNGTSCVFNKTVGSSAGKNWVSTTGTAARLADPQDVAFEYTDTNVLDRLYITEKATGEIMIVDGVAATPTTCTGASKICDNRELKRINGTIVTSGSMVFPASVLFVKTGTGAGVLYAANAASTATDNNVVSFSIGGGSSSTPTTTVAIDQPAANVYSSTLAVSGQVTPTATPVSCSLNGSTTFSSATVTGTSWTISIPSLLADQVNYVTCKTADASDKKNTFYVSSPLAAPALAIVSPADNSVTKNGTVLVSGTSNSAGVSIGSSVAGSTCTTTDASFNWSCSVPLAENANAITISAWKPGTATATASRTVVKDTTAPGVVLSFLTDGAVTNSAVQNIDGIVTEAHFSTVEVDGVPVPASARVVNGTETYFSAPVTLVRGSNVVTVKAIDSLGNFTLTTRTVTLNPEAAGFTVALPADNSYLTAAGSVDASGTADGSFAAVNAYPVSGGTWSGSFSATGGFKDYQFVTTGGSPNVSAKRTINTNVAYANLAITSPAADIATNSSSVVVSGKVSGGLTPKISIDGGAAVAVSSFDAGTGVFSHTVNLGSEGVHAVLVTDNAVTTKAVRNIIYDNTKPVLSIQANSRSMPAEISGSIEGSAKIASISASLSGTPVTIPMTVLTFDAYDAASDTVVWHANLSSYTYDTISFTTTDPAGNDKVRTRTAVIPKGDVDGDGYIRLSDALSALRHSAGTEILTGDAFVQADVGSLVEGRVSSDGDVNIIDAVLILKKSYGLLSF